MRSELTSIDPFFDTECYLIDFLPETVPGDSTGQYFEVESYLLHQDQPNFVQKRFFRVLLKIMCYFQVQFYWNGWTECTSPEDLERIVSALWRDRSASLNCLFPEENALLVMDGDSLNLSIYNPTAKLRRLLEQIARSEGLFWRPAKA